MKFLLLFLTIPLFAQTSRSWLLLDTDHTNKAIIKLTDQADFKLEFWGDDTSYTMTKDQLAKAIQLYDDDLKMITQAGNRICKVAPDGTILNYPCKIAVPKAAEKPKRVCIGCSLP